MNIMGDLTAFSNYFNLTAPTSSNFEIYPMPGLTTTPDSNWTIETCLDIEWAHAIAPNATIVLVEAVSPGLGDLLDAVQYAANQPNVVGVSMSWVANEGSWVNGYDSYFTSNNGAVFFASSGLLTGHGQPLMPNASQRVKEFTATLK